MDIKQRRQWMAEFRRLPDREQRELLGLWRDFAQIYLASGAGQRRRE